MDSKNTSIGCVCYMKIKIPVIYLSTVTTRQSFSMNDVTLIWQGFE